VTQAARTHLVPAQDPTCSVSGCSRRDGGTLTLANRGGGFRVSACDEHGWRAAQGEWFVFDVMGRKCALGGGPTPPHYSPRRADQGVESFPRQRRRQQFASLRLYAGP
jgi:hypothetical protein